MELTRNTLVLIRAEVDEEPLVVNVSKAASWQVPNRIGDSHLCATIDNLCASDPGPTCKARRYNFGDWNGEPITCYEFSCGEMRDAIFFDYSPPVICPWCGRPIEEVQAWTPST